MRQLLHIAWDTDAEGIAECKHREVMAQPTERVPDPKHLRPTLKAADLLLMQSVMQSGFQECASGEFYMPSEDLLRLTARQQLNGVLRNIHVEEFWWQVHLLKDLHEAVQSSFWRQYNSIIILDSI